MIASPPLLLATRAPAPAAAGRTPLVARPAVTRAVSSALIAARDVPEALSAPKLAMAAPALPQAPVPSVRHGSPRGAVLLSTALHLGLVAGWAVFAAPARPLAVPDLDTAQVALISEAQFSALSAPQPQVMQISAPPLAPLALDTPPEAVALPDAPSPKPQPAPMPTALVAQVPAPELAPTAEPAPSPPLPVAKPEPQPKPAAEQPRAEKPKPAAEPRKEKVQKPAEPTQDNKKAAASANSQPEAAQNAAPSKTASAGEAKALKADWGSKVRARINRKVVQPANSGPGTVKVRLELSPSGKLLAVGIAESSGQPALDAAALKAVKAAAPFSRAPKGLTEASYSFSLPITFKS